ncbi:hypothetical protein SAMN06272771_4561 [Streptomyces sp. Ag82_O1-12]|uniref:hypothetical protein n=1 Tax=unclassified Streptomyces TaxID=2593676 RepID=UPI000BC58657|nr:MULTISPECIES: hypothetical protein [unclassified Streptomyces]SMQ18122.1 hypothetical protein SAMN06272771_4561 [Streptomyces sp. Ag82_O1-12]SOD47159.1 hypothetical protein SAMN06272727_4561 [Streptomyces sp. Ag82_G6-1]
MSGSSARPKRRKAAGSALRYEHRPGRPSVSEQEKQGWGCLWACLVLPGFVALIMPLVLFDMYWGHELWGDVAPAWPGGAYAFAGTVGALVPVVFFAWVAPLTRMNWKRSKRRSLAWVAASLPGLAACYLVAGVIATTARPKRRRNWDADCYSRGGPCWVHVHYPWLWAAGLIATLVAAALLIILLVRLSRRATSTPPSTSEPAAAPTPRSPTGIGGRRPPA